jgi:hypothetical protein
LQSKKVVRKFGQLLQLKKPIQSKQSSVGQNIAQSGHPGCNVLSAENKQTNKQTNKHGNKNIFLRTVNETLAG